MARWPRTFMTAAFRDLASSIQLADLVDVLLVASFLFTGITWLRQSRAGSAAHRVVVLGFLFAPLYLLVDYFDS